MEEHQNNIINDIALKEYKEGFVTEVEQEFIPKGSYVFPQTLPSIQ